MYYYKQIDENGEITSVLSCDTYLKESGTQIQITKKEYDEFIASIPEPEEPEQTGYAITSTEIDDAYREGVSAA